MTTLNTAPPTLLGVMGRGLSLGFCGRYLGMCAVIETIYFCFAMFLKRLKTRKVSVYASPYNTPTWKASGLFHCSRKDFNLTAHLVQSIVLSLAQYLTTFIIHPGRTTTRKLWWQCMCCWNNWYKLKAHKWEINQHILDSFSLDSLLKRDFFLILPEIHEVLLF